MPLKDKELRYYDSEVLRLPGGKRAAYHKQVDRLIDTLRKHLRKRARITITRIVSFAKYTILCRAADNPVDVDVVFYVSGADGTKETLESLSAAIYEILIEMYPTKAVEDFEIQRKAATVRFVGSGLSVDIVPVVEDENRPGYGWQFDIRDGAKIVRLARLARSSSSGIERTRTATSVHWSAWGSSGGTAPS